MEPTFLYNNRSTNDLTSFLEMLEQYSVNYSDVTGGFFETKNKNLLADSFSTLDLDIFPSLSLRRFPPVTSNEQPSLLDIFASNNSQRLGCFRLVYLVYLPSLFDSYILRLFEEHV